jgi:hypothetical protein
MEVQPFVGTGRDRFIDGQRVLARADDVHVQDPGRVARPQHSVGVVGIGDFFEDDPEIGLAQGKDPSDFGDAFLSWHV